MSGFLVKMTDRFVEGTDSQGETVEYTVSAVDKLDIEITEADADDVLVAVEVSLSALVAYWICSDQVIILETNSSTHAGGDIITLQPNEPISWHAQSQHAKHFTQNISGIYLTKGDPTEGGTAVVNIRIARNGR